MQHPIEIETRQWATSQCRSERELKDRISAVDALKHQAESRSVRDDIAHALRYIRREITRLRRRKARRRMQMETNVYA